MESLLKTFDVSMDTMVRACSELMRNQIKRLIGILSVKVNVVHVNDISCEGLTSIAPTEEETVTLSQTLTDICFDEDGQLSLTLRLKTPNAPIGKKVETQEKHESSEDTGEEDSELEVEVDDMEELSSPQPSPFATIAGVAPSADQATTPALAVFSAAVDMAKASVPATVPAATRVPLAHLPEHRKRGSVTECPKNNKRRKEDESARVVEEYSPDVDNQVSGVTAMEKRVHAARCVRQKYTMKDISITQGRNNRYHGQPVCLWCLRSADTIYETFQGMNLLMSPCCGTLVCPQCLGEAAQLAKGDKGMVVTTALDSMPCLVCHTSTRKPYDRPIHLPTEEEDNYNEHAGYVACYVMELLLITGTFKDIEESRHAKAFMWLSRANCQKGKLTRWLLDVNKGIPLKHFLLGQEGTNKYVNYITQHIRSTERKKKSKSHSSGSKQQRTKEKTKVVESEAAKCEAAVPQRVVPHIPIDTPSLGDPLSENVFQGYIDRAKHIDDSSPTFSEEATTKETETAAEQLQELMTQLEACKKPV